MMAKGMYKVVDGAVVVDPNANTSFATVSASVKLPDGSANAPAGGSGSGSTSGSQTPSGGSADEGGFE